VKASKTDAAGKHQKKEENHVEPTDERKARPRPGTLIMSRLIIHCYNACIIVQSEDCTVL